jgi:glycine/D-amino acid oxidase-like deaminating enzyme
MKMKIHNGTLYWPSTYYKKLFTTPEIKPFYDVIIVGGGMSGLLAAAELQKDGHSIAILEQKEAVKGSTSANTGLLQWTNDIMLHELINQIGVEKAVRFHILCKEAITNLEKLASTMEDHGDFIRRPSIMFASKKGDVKKLEKEYDAMQKHGFAAEFWNDHLIKQKMKIDAPAALKTFQDAEINPFKFGVQLLEQLVEKGVHLFEQTYVNIIEEQGDFITIHSQNKIFKTKKIVYTTGYQPVPFGKIAGANVNRSYAIVTHPIPHFEGWHEHAMLWETARPYFYIRRTVDDRIIVGGLDESKSKAPKEANIEEHAEQLLEMAKHLFPQYTLIIDAMYGASFGESKDNLPFIGEHPEHPNHYYLLGYGGNGTVCSMLGATILADLIANRKNEDAEIVTLNRKYGAK